MSDCKFCEWKNPNRSNTSIVGVIVRDHHLTNHLLEHLIEQLQKKPYDRSQRRRGKAKPRVYADRSRHGWRHQMRSGGPGPRRG